MSYWKSYFVFPLIAALFLVSVLLPRQGLAQVDQLVNPPEAQAGVFNRVLGTTFDVLCDYTEWNAAGLCELNSSFWSAGMLINNLFLNPITLAVCDKTWDTAVKDGVCLDPNERNEKIEIKSDVRNGKLTRIPGSGISLLAGSYVYALNDDPPIPIDLAFYFRDLTSDTMFGTPAYAQTPLDKSLEGLVLGGWKLTRNIALSLFGMVVAITALMIMFRSKISPQVTVSVYSVLPMIPVVLVLIMLSYPIIALAYSFIGPLTGLALRIGSSLVLDSFMLSTELGVGSDIAPQYIMWILIAGAVNAVFSAITLIGIGGLAIFFFFSLAIVVVTFTIIIGLFAFARAFAMLILYAILSPLIVLVGLIPGRKNVIVNLGKRILIEIITIPTLVLAIMVGLAIIAYVPRGPDYITPGNPFAVPGLIISQAGVLFLILIKYFIGLGVIWKARNVHKNLEGLLGVGNLFGIEEEKKR